MPASDAWKFIKKHSIKKSFELTLVHFKNFSTLKSCQPEPVEGGFIKVHRFRQAANDMYFKALTFKLLSCQPEPVEGGFITKDRVRQAHPDILLIAEFVICKEPKTFYECLNLTTFQPDLLLKLLKIEKLR